MAYGMQFGEESRTATRFEPNERLSVYLVDNTAFLVQGDVKNLSEVGACVRTNAAVKPGGRVTVDVRSGYSFLFRADARIVWCSEVLGPRTPHECLHGIRFMDLSPFSRKLIRRLRGDPAQSTTATATKPANRPRREKDADSDPDLEILFRETASLGPVDDDWFEMLTDPTFDALLFEGPDSINGNGWHPAPNPAEPASTTSSAGAAPETQESGLVDLANSLEGLGTGGSRLEDPSGRTRADIELSGNLGFFSNTDILQMLESARVTGILCIDGDHAGEIHLRDGRICGCFSNGSSVEEVLYRLLVAREGRFRFTASEVRTNIRTNRTTTQLLLEAELRRDQDS